MNRTYVQIKAWNTGRHYTAAGQRVAAGITEDGTIHFADIDRQIFGVIKNNIAFTHHSIMKAYDNNRYDGDDIDATLMHHAAQQ